MSYAAISFHFDSLGEAYGFPDNYQDPSFSEIAQRFFDIAERRGFRYTIFIIARDLEREENRRAVKRWSLDGHEIGSHSYSHRFDFGALGRRFIRRDLQKAHDLIMETTGTAPTGFSAPAWSSSNDLTAVLEELAYTYDASLMPSWLRYPAMAMAALNYLGTRRVYYCVHQRHVLHPLFGNPRTQVSPGGVLQMPLPTDRYRFASWHTVAFALGWKTHERILRRALDEVEAFYYVVHPADLLSGELLKKDSKIHLARVHVPLDIKKRYLEDSLDIIQKSGRKIVTMGELADAVRPGRDSRSRCHAAGLQTEGDRCAG